MITQYTKEDETSTNQAERLENGFRGIQRKKFGVGFGLSTDWLIIRGYSTECAPVNCRGAASHLLSRSWNDEAEVKE